MSGKQVTDNKKWRYMETQPDYSENFDEAGEQPPKGISQEEMNRLISIEPDTGSGESEIADDDGQVDGNDIYADAEEVSKEIEKVFKEDPQLMVKLLKVAETFIYGLTGSYQINKLGAHDIVMESIEAILTLKRKWYKSKCPNIVVLLIGVCKSKIRNFVNGNDYKNKNKVIPLYPVDEENKNGNSIYDDEQGKRYDKNDQIFDKSDEAIIQNLLDLFKDDDVAYCVLDELLRTSDYDVKEQNQLLAKNLGISVKEVENAKKRIKYKILLNLSKQKP